jgi:hypothetical protein
LACVSSIGSLFPRCVAIRQQDKHFLAGHKRDGMIAL